MRAYEPRRSDSSDSVSHQDLDKLLSLLRRALSNVPRPDDGATSPHFESPAFTLESKRLMSADCRCGLLSLPISQRMEAMILASRILVSLISMWLEFVVNLET